MNWIFKRWFNLLFGLHIFQSQLVYHYHSEGRHLPLQLVDQDLGTKSDIYFIVVTLIYIDHLGFQIKKQIFMSWQIFSTFSTFSLLHNQTLKFTSRSKKVLGWHMISFCSMFLFLYCDHTGMYSNLPNLSSFHEQFDLSRQCW